MNPPSPQLRPVTVHCQYRSLGGRRCRMAVCDSESGLCFRHAALKKKERDTSNIAAALIGNVEEFRSAVDINRSLGALLKLLARDEIAPRRAAVMAYTCNLLLRTLPAISQEEQAANESDPAALFGPDVQELIEFKRRHALEMYAKSTSGDANSAPQGREGEPTK